MSNTFTVNTYSPKDVRLTIGGYIFTGWQSITINRSTKVFNPYRGIRGKNSRVRNKDTSATIIIPLLQTSPGNDVLSEILAQDAVKGTSRIALTLSDKSGNSVFSSNEAYIPSYPITTFSGGFEYRNWEIFCQSTDSYTVGGNSRPSTSLFDSAINEVSSLVNNIF